MPRLTFIAYLDSRLFEWTKSMALLLIGLAMLVWPVMSHGTILQILVGILGGQGTAIFFVIVGLCSGAALIANGQSLWIGPWTRSLGAAVRATIWTSFTLSMLRVSVEQGFPSPMVFFFGIFAIVEVFISYRAVLDVRSID